MTPVYRFHKNQHGAALMVFMLLLILTSSYYLLTRVNTSIRQSVLERETVAALNQAKQALIGYAVSYPDRVNNNEGPGYLPCPDTDNDGDAESNCSDAGMTTTGRFPYETLEMGELRDAVGNRLWYGLSENFRYGVNKLVPVNSESPAIAGLTLDSTSDIVAVIIAPMEPVSSQARDPSETNIISEIPNYLEDDNNDLDSRYVSISTGEYNDIVMPVSRQELIRAVEKRVLGEVKVILDNYETAYDAYPWLSTYTDPKTDRRRLHGTAGNDSTGLVLDDNRQDFTEWGVQPGDVVYNITDGSRGIISIVNDSTRITATSMQFGQDNSFDAGDEYQIVTGSGTDKFNGVVTGLTGGFTLEDNTRNFEDLGVSAGDVIENITDGTSFIINAIDNDEITVGTANVFNIGDTYRIRHTAVAGAATNSTSSTSMLQDTTRDFTGTGVQAGHLLINDSDKSFGIVDTVGTNTITVDALVNGDNNDIENGDFYIIPAVSGRFDEVTGSREGHLGFHEAGEYFQTAYDLDWSIFISDMETDDYTTGLTFPLALEPTYQNALEYSTQTSAASGTFNISEDMSGCDWTGEFSAYCYAKAEYPSFFKGVATSGSATTLVDTSVNFSSLGVKPGDQVYNVSDQISLELAGTATAGANDTTLEDTVNDNFNTLDGNVLQKYIILNLADNTRAGIKSIISSSSISIFPVNGTFGLDIGENYEIYRISTSIVTAVTPDTLTLKAIDASADFSAGDDYRLFIASRLTTDTVTQKIATRIVGGVDYLTDGIEIGDTFYNVTNDEYGIVSEVGIVGFNEYIIVDYLPSAVSIGDSIEIYRDFVTEREYDFSLKFRGTGFNSAISADGRSRDICVGYGADCTSAASKEDIESIYDTRISVTDIDDDGNNINAILGVNSDNDLNYPEGSIRLSGLRYYLSRTDPVASIPSWLIRNNWHHLTYVAYSSDDSPGTTTDCTTGTNCLTLAGTGNPSNNKSAMVLMAGRALSTQDRSSIAGNPDLYFENENNSGSDDLFERNELSPSFNDQIRIIGVSP